MSDMIVPIIVLCVCLVSCAVSSMAMGSFKNMFGGIGSLFGGIGSLFSGDAFRPPSFEKVGTIKKDDLKPATAECDEECQKAGALVRVFARAPKKL